MIFERNFLDHYFLSVYNKLEADALLFNRKLPHMGLMGSENEFALSSLIRDFLPSRFGVETSGIVIDRHGNESKQCDIIIYDDQNFPKYFRKVFPVELVYGVIEVKTNLTNGEAINALNNLEATFKLDFRPLLSNYWQTMSKEKNLIANPPFGMIFGYRSEVAKFETFSDWFALSNVHRGIQLDNNIRTLTIASLDKGIIKMESSNLWVERWALIAEEDAYSRSFITKVDEREVYIDPAKVLLTFLETLWQRLWQHHLHPRFDIRSYMSYQMSSFVDLGSKEELIQNET